MAWTQRIIYHQNIKTTWKFDEMMKYTLQALEKKFIQGKRKETKE